MNNYNIILECIDEINDSVVTTESNVIKSLMNSYYKQYELFTECEYLGKDPYKIYQEASIMDEVKEKSSKDKNKLISIVKLVPRLIIALINKIKNKLFKKGNNITNVDKQAIEETRKAVSNSKTGKIVLGGGVIVTALGAGGLVISKVIKNKGKSSTKVEVEITKDNKVKCDFDIKAIKELVKVLVGDMKKVMEQYEDTKVKKVSQSIVDNIIKNTEKLNDELKKENKNGDKVEVKSGDFNIESIVADLQYVKDNTGTLYKWDEDEALVKYIERLPAAVNAVETAINKFADLNSIVRSLKKQQSSGGNKNKNDGVSVETKTRNKEKLKTPEKHNNQEQQELSTEALSTRNNINTFNTNGSTVEIAELSGTTENVNDDAKNLKKFVDTVKNKLPDIKSAIDEDYYNEISEAINKSYKILEGLTNDNSEENLKKKYGILYNIHSAINSACKGTPAFRYGYDRSAKLFKRSKTEVIEKFLVDVGYREMTDEFKVGNDFKEVYDKKLGEWFESIEECDNLLANDWKINVKPNKIATIIGYPYILDMDKLKLGDSTKKDFKTFRDQGMFIIKGFRIFERVEG